MNEKWCVGMNERIAVVETKLDTLNTNHEDLKTMMRDFIKTSDKKYASKLTEKIVYGMAGVILTSVLLVVLAVVVG